MSLAAGIPLLSEMSSVAPSWRDPRLSLLSVRKILVLHGSPRMCGSDDLHHMMIMIIIDRYQDLIDLPL